MLVFQATDVSHSAPNTFGVFIKQTHQAEVAVSMSFVRVFARYISLLIVYAFKGGSRK